ncbi:unnamed protein product [Symbiodinium natans]|uniref:Uncharacterized protein n=1 Tax=Symbiodinium natans TaxID=878477 RepID=A0A812I5G9_9DINO|nr:unnamed protein product [Symbiodinium natans]
MEAALPSCTHRSVLANHLSKLPASSSQDQAQLGLPGATTALATLLVPASAGFVGLAARRRVWSKAKRSEKWCAKLTRLTCSRSDKDGDEGSKASKEERNDIQDTGAGGPDELDDAAFFAAFRKRAQEVEQQEMERQGVVDRNWQAGRADVKVGAVANDWVRRVILVDDELFVGTATRGVQRYGLGSDEPRQFFPVSGDPTRSVPADHQAEYDPETSVTSIAWSGRCLFAGLAGGRVHAWREDGTLLLDTVVCPENFARPCFVYVHENMLIAAAGEAVMRWHVDELESDESDGAKQPARIKVNGNVHSLAAGFEGSFALGLEDGTLEVRSLEHLNLLSRRAGAHRFAISAVLVTAEQILTGDAAGNLVSWRAGAAMPGEDWEKLWQREHRGRVVAISQGGGEVIVSAALDSFIRVWNAESGDLLFAIPEHRVWLGSLSMSPDCSLMATDGRDNAVYLYRFSED